LSKATWLLAAISVAVTPTIDTPSSTVNGGCILLRCVDPASGCMKGDLLSGWSSDLGVRDVSVSVSVNGDNITAGPCPDGSGPSCAPLMYPYVSVTNLVSDSAAPPTNASFIGYKNRPIAGSLWRQNYNAQGRVWSGRVSNQNVQALGDDLFAAAGVWVTAYWGSIF
jgi:hypothetical protein